jgi:dihydrofolate reductase
MRDLIVTENITLDGVIEATEGWFDAASGEDDVSDVETALRKQREGRRCAAPRAGDVRADAWLLAAADRRHDGHHRLPQRRFEVRGLQQLQDPEWERTAVPRSVDDIRALKSETGADIVTTGSIRLVRELIAAGLVDEYRLFTYPVVLGRGQRLFADATEVPRLRLVENQSFRSGIVLLRYRTLCRRRRQRCIANALDDCPSAKSVSTA